MVDRNFMTVTNRAKQGNLVKIEANPTNPNKQGDGRRGIGTPTHKVGVSSDRFDWAKLKKIDMSKQLVKGSFLCFWVN